MLLAYSVPDLKRKRGFILVIVMLCPLTFASQTLLAVVTRYGTHAVNIGNNIAEKITTIVATNANGGD